MILIEFVNESMQIRFLLFLGMIVNGFVNVNVSTLERRFQLSSSQLGLVCGAYDLFNIIFNIPFAFIGGRGC